jgi:hypothetical protein
MAEDTPGIAVQLSFATTEGKEYSASVKELVLAMSRLKEDDLYSIISYFGDDSYNKSSSDASQNGQSIFNQWYNYVKKQCTDFPNENFCDDFCDALNKSKDLADKYDLLMNFWHAVFVLKVGVTIDPTGIIATSACIAALLKILADECKC